MNINQKLELIKRNTEEIIGEEELLNLLKSKKRPSVYLGTAITGSPHIAYFLWANKLADFSKVGFKVKILLADVHGALDSTPWSILEKRYDYYESLIPLLFESLGVKRSSIEFIRGSKFQISKDYILDLLRLSTYVTVHDATKAASEVVKLGDNPKLAGIIYPLMQALDEEYLDVDVQYGGVDQRKIFVLASDILPKIGYKKRIHVMTPIVPGLLGKKMSSSVQGSKIDLLDSQDEIKRKIKNAECEEGNPDNGVMAFLKQVIFPIKIDSNQKFVVRRPDKFGGDIAYNSYKDLEHDFISKKMHPLDVKNALSEEIISLLKPIENQRKTLEKLYAQAYP